MKCPTCENAGYDESKELARGRPAFQGCVEGAVRVVMDPKDADAVMAGEVLVTPMTDPDSVPAMQRAAAIVTDRGGVLCHAAIVCRELSKPCIVGTMTATSRLVTGMRVRVCAQRGAVFAVATVEA